MDTLATAKSTTRRIAAPSRDHETPAPDTFINIGCGLTAPAGWLNLDASARLRLPWPNRFPRNVVYCCVVAGLPVAPGTAAGVYASHVLEHLSLADMRKALRNIHGALRPGGIFRLVVPDLRSRAMRYLENGDAPEFVSSLGMGTAGSRSLIARLRDALGNSRHQWMWDYPSLTAELENSGFAVRRAEFGDSFDPMFALVEQRDRFEGRFPELAIEALK